MLQVPVRLGTQALFALELECNLLTAALSIKLDPSGAAASSSLTELLLSRSFTSHISAAETMALIIRRRAEQLLTEFALVKSLCPVPPAATVADAARQRLLRAGSATLFDGKVTHLEFPRCSDSVLAAHMDRLRACRARAHDGHAAFLALTRRALGHPEQTTVEAAAHMWAPAGAAAVQLLRGALWVPLYVAAQCTLAEIVALLWRQAALSPPPVAPRVPQMPPPPPMFVSRLASPVSPTGVALGVPSPAIAVTEVYSLAGESGGVWCCCRKS